MPTRSSPLTTAALGALLVLTGCSVAQDRGADGDDQPAVATPAGADDAATPTSPSATAAADPEAVAAMAARREAAGREAMEHRREQRAAAERRRAAEVRRQEAEARRRAAERRAREERIRRQQTTRVQEVLAANGYYAGPIDGEAGPATTSAVLAFQKVQGISRDGVIGPQTLDQLDQVRQPPLVGGAATRIEIDLDRQVVHLVRGGTRLRTMNASSGNGEVYTWPDGRVARADTPVGTFTIERRIEGLRDGDLGSMYDPMYFHQGWALHGSNSVPAHPASHGCVRLSRSDALWVASQVPNGTQVVVHGSVNSFDPDTETVWL